MQADLPLLKAGPTLGLRKERIDCPELGGSVIVVGLTASQAFAVMAVREQALARLHTEMQQARKAGEAVSEAQRAELLASMDAAEWQQYGRYVPELLARAVQIEGGNPLYTADEWELAQQHHPELLPRLQRVAERLSGIDGAERQKNSRSQG